MSSDLTSSEVEKLTKLIEDLDQDEDFESNVKTIKESYFSGSKETLQLDEEVVSDMMKMLRLRIKSLTQVWLHILRQLEK